jgi:uncharacterized membrane protein
MIDSKEFVGLVKPVGNTVAWFICTGREYPTQ